MISPLRVKLTSTLVFLALVASCVWLGTLPAVEPSPTPSAVVAKPADRSPSPAAAVTPSLRATPAPSPAASASGANSGEFTIYYTSNILGETDPCG